MDTSKREDEYGRDVIGNGPRPGARTAAAVVAGVLAFLLAGCGGDEKPPGEGEPVDDDVERALTELGVDVAQSARLGDDLEALPEDYSPFGASRSFDTLEELLLLGTTLDPAAGFDSQMTLLEVDRLGTSVSYATDVLFAPKPSDTPWALSQGDAPECIRDATRGDFDGDGLDELAVVYRAPGEKTIRLDIYDDQTGGFAKVETLDLSSDTALELTAIAADFTGDGFADLAVGLTSSDGAVVLFVRNDRGGLLEAEFIATLPQTVPSSALDLVLAAGNLDYDPSAELVIVLNEVYWPEGPGGVERGISRFTVVDDAKRAFAQAHESVVRPDPSVLNRSAVVADVALGDIDGDNIDELVFAGLTHFDPRGTCAYNVLLIALDDLERELDTLGAVELQPNIHGGCASEPGILRFVHVDTLDVDGDGVAEVQANGKLFEDFYQFPPWTGAVDSEGTLMEIPHASLFADDDGRFGGQFNRRNSSMTVADFTADKRQDVVFYSQATNRLEIWGLSDPDPDLGILGGTWRMLHDASIAAPVDAEPIRPVLLPLNVNHDSLSISFDQGDYRLIFTEPIILAALAAPPCYADLGQNTDACRTAYGAAESTTVETEDTLTITIGATVGFESEFSVLGVKTVGIEVLATLTAHAGLVRSSAYTLTKRVVYTTGPIEDTVILTTVPLDQYTYTITSHPDDELIGSKVVVAVPRSPVELQVERGFYNEHAVAGGPRIDTNVFSHTAGDPRSYPGSAAKDSTLTSYRGFDIGPATVGQGGGDETLEINVATESGLGITYGVEFELAVQATAGVVVAGFSVGIGFDSTLKIVHGKEATYTGTVASLPAGTFAQYGYDWGMFTHIVDDHPAGQQFEVINYWVD